MHKFKFKMLTIKSLVLGVPRVYNIIMKEGSSNRA